MDDLASFGTVFIIVVYACIWSIARSDASDWARDCDLQSVTPLVVARKVLTVLLVSWIWLFLLVVLLMLLQDYVLKHLRGRHHPSLSKHGSTLSISFGRLLSTSTGTALLASITATILFAWISSARAMVGRSRPEPQRRLLLIATVSQSMTFNLVVVVATLFLTTLFIPSGRPD